MSVIAFACLIVVGACLLMLPEASRTDKSIGVVNALFTATSAACVTGLIVLDTGKDLSLYGQAVVLFLIQVGGLGIITMSTVFILLAGRRPGSVSRTVLQDTFTHGRERRLSNLILDILRFTFIIEGVGALLLFIGFLPGKTYGEALYLAVFHAISAFCNAGFSIFSDSLIGFRQNGLINFVICVLIIMGGIGFLVLSELKNGFPYNRRKWQRLSLHTKLVISTTILLLVGGTLVILFMERQNMPVSLSAGERLMSSIFQSVTARTAGFNTLRIDMLANETLFVMIVLMFIGASPGSCGGGIKTCTFATLALMGLSRLRGQRRPQIFKRSVSMASLARANSVFVISIGVVVIGTMLLLMTEIGDTPHPLSRGKFLEVLFEAVSAFGTVGLSMGITPVLSTGGKLLIVMLMFIGRLGPLLIGLAVSRQAVDRFHYAEENVMIG